MKLSSLQENLKAGLFAVSHVAGKNVNLPILNNVLIEAMDANIRLIATNLEIGVVARIRGKIEEEGSFTVDSKIIADYVSLLPNKKVEIEQKGNELLVKSDNYKTKIIGQSAEDYPLIPSVDRQSSYSANIEDFKKSLSQVIFAVSNSETRVELSGVFFSFEGDKLVLAATDSYRLAEKTTSLKINGKKENIENKKIIVPSKTLHELIRILSLGKEDDVLEGEKNEIIFYISDNQILFTFGNIELVSRLIEGQYPDYKQIIPPVSKTKALVNKNEFLRAVKASALFSRSGINDINLDLPSGKNKLIISSASGQTGENITELEAEVGGEDNGVVVNFKYLLDGLNSMESDNIKIEIIDSNTPCIVQPEKDKNYLYIIMPIKQ
jgi:DNA polymerase III subunit beta